jgi:hypothetical protein
MIGKKMSPDEKIDLFLKHVEAAIDKYKTIQTKRADLSERTMKVIDHKVVAVGEMIQAKNRLAAERSLDQALEAVKRLNNEFDKFLAAEIGK